MDQEPSTLTCDSIERALKNRSMDAELQSLFGMELYHELQGLISVRRRRLKKGVARRVLILHDVFGSKLTQRSSQANSIWPAVGERISDLRLEEAKTKLIADDALPYYYLLLRTRLRAAGFDADFLCYDWRQSLSELQSVLTRAIVKDPAEQILIVAHGMGGLICRAALTSSAPRLKKIARIVLLGTPNRGTYLSMQLLCQQSPLVSRLLAAEGESSGQSQGPDLAQTVSSVFRTFPSLYELLPTNGEYGWQDLFSLNNWPKAYQTTALDPRLLESGRGVLDSLCDADSRLRIIAGTNRDTVSHFRVTPLDRIEFQFRCDGDGMVTTDSAQLSPEVPTWYVSEDHGGLLHNREVADAIVDVLSSPEGHTLRLTTARPLIETSLPRKRLHEQMIAVASGHPSSERELNSPHELMTSLFCTIPASNTMDLEQSQPVLTNASAAPANAPSRTAAVTSPVNSAPASNANQIGFGNLMVGRRRKHLEIVLVNGDLADVPTRCHLLGLFDGVSPSGAARTLDIRTDGLISDFVARHLLDRTLGKVTLLPVNSTSLPTDVIAFVGLGDPGDFSAERQKVIGVSAVTALARLRIHEFATVLIGKRSDPVNPDQRVPSPLSYLLEGFLIGLRDCDNDQTVSRIIFALRDQSRYEQLKFELYMLASTKLFDDFDIFFSEMPVTPLVTMSPAAKQALTATVPPDEAPNYLTVGGTVTDDGKVALKISFLSASSRGSIDSQERTIHRAELERVLSQFDPDTGLTSQDALATMSDELSGMLFPSGFVKNLIDSGLSDSPLRIVHDTFASRIPWEVIRFGQSWPALEKGLTRHFQGDQSTRKWLRDRVQDSTLQVLIVIDPSETLPSAEVEGQALRRLLGPGFRANILQGSQATRDALRKEFESGAYDVVHFAGHAGFDPQDPSKQGLLCADNRFLAGADLLELTSLPVLVFLNACRSGRIRGAVRDPKQVLRTDPLHRSVSVAEAFLQGGLKLFLATYWPVTDSSAEIFSQNFYSSVVAGKSVGEAVLAARQQIRQQGRPDWADYICYGDPRFVLKQASIASHDKMATAQ